MGACTTLLLFGIGMMGALFMIVLAFVNLWGYSAIEAALAITPVPIMAMIVSPLVGRLSSRVAPRAFAVPALLVMAGSLFALSALPAEPSFGSAAWRLALLGIGVGAAFPAVTIGSMGSIRGQEIGLGSGIVNMARQVGFAIGIAVFVAVFTGTIDTQREEARERIAALSSPSPSVSREIVREELRDAYGGAFLVGGFVVLLGIPFSLTMRRGPSDVHRGSEAAAVAAG
jgi:MFS family permease